MRSDAEVFGLSELAFGRAREGGKHKRKKVAAPDLSISHESPLGADARRCLAAYFEELAVRFEHGFDAAGGLASAGEDFAPPDGALFVARLGEEAVGCGGLVAQGPETGEIKRVWTSPGARGRGVARAVLEAIESEARRRGYRLLRLDTNRALLDAIAMYRKAGFREIDRYNENPYAHHWFEKTL